MNRIKDILNKYITIKRIGKHGKFVILNTSISVLEKELIKRSEQFYCASKEHYPEMVGDGICDKQCVRCRTKKQ